jgi:hypothetical protein
MPSGTPVQPTDAAAVISNSNKGAAIQVERDVARSDVGDQSGADGDCFALGKDDRRVRRRPCESVDDVGFGGAGGEADFLH